MSTANNLRLAKCESPIERTFVEHVMPLFHEGVTWDTQVVFAADGNRYRVDLFAEGCGRRVVIECDGRDFHDYDDDRVRDLVMLNANAVDVVVRVRGCDITFEPDAGAAALRLFVPFLVDAERKPLGLPDSVLNSAMLRGGAAKPVIRARFPLNEYSEVSGELRNFPTYVAMGRTSDFTAVIAQFQTPKFDRTYAAPRAWHVGQCFDELAAKLEQSPRSA